LLLSYAETSGFIVNAKQSGTNPKYCRTVDEECAVLDQSNEAEEKEESSRRAIYR